MGLVVSSKRPKVDKSDEQYIEDIDYDSDDEKEMMLRLVGTSNLSHAKGALPYLHKEHKIVEIVDYNPGGSIRKEGLLGQGLMNS